MAVRKRKSRKSVGCTRKYKKAAPRAKKTARRKRRSFWDSLWND